MCTQCLEFRVKAIIQTAFNRQIKININTNYEYNIIINHNIIFIQ